MQRFKFISDVHLLLIKNDQILLLRRANTGYEDGNYSLPAGHLEGNETTTAGLLREIREEVGITIIPEKLSFAHIMHRKSNDERMSFFFAAKEWQGKPTNCEPEKCDELKWFPMDNLPKNTIPYIRSAINSYQNKILFSEFGW